jgi:molecular chaperone GrpE
MSYMYDPRYRRTRPGQPAVRAQAEQQMPSYEELAAAYLNLNTKAEAQAKEIEARKAELKIKNEALHKQAEDLKQTQAELVWARAALQQAQQEKDAQAKEGNQESWQERYARLQADVENLRRRWEQRSADETAEARRAILRDMLPLADHLDMALEHGAELEGDAAQQFVANIEATRRAFLDTLRRYGVEAQTPAGKPFDPALYEAVGQVVAEGSEPGSVVHVVQTGYMEGDKLLRPARVIVNQGA